MTHTTTFMHGASGYSNHGCRCLTCRAGWRDQARRYRGSKPSLLALEVEQLRAEVQRLYREIDWLHAELDRARNS